MASAGKYKTSVEVDAYGGTKVMLLCKVQLSHWPSFNCAVKDSTKLRIKKRCYVTVTFRMSNGTPSRASLAACIVVYVMPVCTKGGRFGDTRQRHICVHGVADITCLSRGRLRRTKTLLAAQRCRLRRTKAGWNGLRHYLRLRGAGWGGLRHYLRLRGAGWDELRQVETN
jgi:hypothetical protein